MRRVAPLVVAVALVAAGCGGHSAPATEAAQLVPADALAYVAVAPNALARAQVELPSFGAAAAAIPYLRPGETAKLRDGVVAFARPADEKAFVAGLDARGELHAKIRGWIVYARTKQPIDDVRHAKLVLADTQRFGKAIAALPGDAVVRAYERRARGWTAAALALHGADATLEVATPHANPPRPPASLAGEIPAGAVAAVSGSAANTPPGTSAIVRALSQILGADVGSLLASAKAPFVLYAIPGEPVPDVTFAAAGRSRALETEIRSLAAQLAGAPVPKPPAAVDLGPVTLHYGPIAGQLVLSDADDPAGELLGGEKLTGVRLFRDAAAAARMPQAGEGFLYVDARRALAAARTLAALANRPLPPALVETLGPLRALLVWNGMTNGIRTTVYLRMS